MIPKVIHYFWLSGDPLPKSAAECIDSWARVMPDYEIVKWDAKKFDVGINRFCAAAFAARKWAFVTDVGRLHALHEHGGIYLDTDVLVRKRFDEFLPHRFFSAIEFHPKVVKEHGTMARIDADGVPLEPGARKPGIGMQAAILGAEAGHPLLHDCLDYYDQAAFEWRDGGPASGLVAPDIYALKAERYGFRYKDERQVLDQDILILPTEALAGNASQATRNTYAIHNCAGSWREPPEDLLGLTISRVKRVGRRLLMAR